jgi:hypothetical protein
MEILIVQVFVSLLLVAGGVLALAYSLKQADHEHADRLSLLPLQDTDTDTEHHERDHAGATTDHL